MALTHILLIYNGELQSQGLHLLITSNLLHFTKHVESSTYEFLGEYRLRVMNSPKVGFGR